MPVIHVVDDDRAVRESLNALLTNNGFTVQTYARGSDFLSVLDTDIEAGCIILDHQLPDTTGLALLGRVTRRSSMPVIMATGHADIRLAVEAMKAGAADFIEKPIAAPELLRRLGAVIAKAPAPDQAEAFDGLTAREREVLDQLMLGRTAKEMARALNISPRTAEAHRRRVMQKTKAENLSHLVRIAMRAGLDPAAP
ncbi:MAG: response regulator [Alphaproteobacteria bacterium]|nr:response regulator [Alphaproteobacteria bacterium]